MSRSRLKLLLSLVGAVAFVLAASSLIDIIVPRPFDGVVLEADAPGRLVVREVLGGSGAERAGIRPGDQIVGIDRSVLDSGSHAARLLAARRIGDSVAYLVRRDGRLTEVTVELGRRFVGSASYFFACLLGFAFFGVGLFVRRRQPDQRAAQIFFLLCSLFMIFLVCRLRPASYQWLDAFVLEAGALALMLLPATFLHFFLVFPRPLPLRPTGAEPDYAKRRRRWLALLGTVYLVPILLPIAVRWTGAPGGESPRLISGAPAASWWLLGLYFVLGLAALGANARRLGDERQRRGVGLLLAGSLFGLAPFLVIAVARPTWLLTDPHAFLALAPLTLVPLTFAVAIVRFGLLDIQVLVRRSLVYTAVSIALTVSYAVALGLFNAFAIGSKLALSPWFPIFFALAVLLLFEPLRLRSQEMVDRFALGDRRRLQEAVRELGRATSAQVDLEPVVRDLVERLPRLLGLHFAALYLDAGGELRREAGPAVLPAKLPPVPELRDALAARGSLAPLAELPGLAGASAAADLVAPLAEAGVEWLTDLTSPRRRIGLVLLSKPAGQLALGEEELALLDSLFDQAAMALETHFLLGERARQAELERELEIASTVQAELLPRALRFGEGWRVAAVCRPARHVGGDFFAELPARQNGARAIVFGDVAGKSVAGALRMMAAHEALQSLALTHRDPEQLFELANRRLYLPGAKRSFVALAYLAALPDGDGIEYLVAGQPQLLVRGRGGEVRALPLPAHRLPVGALLEGRHVLSQARLEPGELILGYSDGVIEAQSPAGEFFGDQRLARALAEAEGSPDGVVAGVLAAIEEFTRGAEPYDDITLVALARDAEVAT